MDFPSPEQTATTSARPAFARWLETANTVTHTFLSAGRIPDLINLAGGLPAPEAYPAAGIAQIARRAIEEHPQDTLGYNPVEGLPELRDAIAARFSTSDLRLGRGNVLITTSGMQGLDLLGKALIEAGGLIAGQFPTYLGAIDAWRPRSPAYRSLILEDPGFDPVEALRGAQFAYTVPNFSNPTGRLVPVPMRQALVDAAHVTGTWLVEDDPYGGLHYDGAPLPRVIELSGSRSAARPYDGPVIYMGTLSKEIAPGLRIGWVVAAPAMIEVLIYNPVRGIRRLRRDRTKPRQNRPWAEAECRMVLDAAPPYLRIPIALAMFAGFRKGDVLTVTKAALRDRMISVVTGKRGVAVAVPVHSTLAEILASAPQHDALTLAANSRGQPWTESGYNSTFGKFIDRLEQEGRVQPGLTMHGLRHTLGTRLREAGADLDDIRRLLGQRTLSMAQHYSETADRSDRAREAVSRIDLLGNRKRTKMENQT